MSTNITMTFEEFCKEAKRYLEGKHPEATIVIRHVTKNNGLVLTGISVQKGEKVLPILYLEKYWKEFRSNEDLPKIFEEIDKTLSQKVEFPVDPDIKDFEKLKNWLCLRVINKDLNKTLLETTPYITVLDLAVVFYIYLGNGASIQVNDEIVKAWGIEKETFIKEYMPIALVNTEKILPANIFNMTKFVDSITGIESVEEDIPNDIMWVMTNHAKYYGAAAIATAGSKLKRFAEEHKSGFYILPSSLHELILVLGDYNRKDSKSMYTMVREVNRTMVSPDEILSDNVYYFDPAKGYPEIAL